MVYVTSEAQRRAFKKWRAKNKEKIKEYDQKRYLNPEYRKRLRESAKKYQEKQLEKILPLFPKKCVICGQENQKIRYHLHKIDGTPHSPNNTYKMALEKPEDFIRLCRPCHVRIHWWMKHIQFLKELEPLILWNKK